LLKDFHLKEGKKAAAAGHGSVILSKGGGEKREVVEGGKRG